MGSMRFDRGSRFRLTSSSRSARQQGFAIIEVLITGIILAIATVGLALLLSRGQQFVIAQGDTNVALHLAQQKLERLSGLGFSASIVGDRTNGDGVVNGCGVAGTNSEPCYNETLTAGLGQQTPTTTTTDTQTFTRLTCVRYVQDDNPELPADPLQPPSTWTCPSCVQGAPASCTRQTKRIKVAVIPTLVGNADATTPLDPNRVTLEAVVTPIPRP
jgi:Tfp pilus assembly protein PilV